MTVLFDSLLSLSRYIAPMHNGESTATGTTATLIDATRVQANDQFNSGVLFILTGTYANSYKTITDYASSTGTFTFTPAVANNVPSGVLYSAFALHSGINVFDMIASINEALFECGDVLQEDTTLTTLTDEDVYSLPNGVENVKEVWIAENTTEPYGWRPFTHWREINGSLRIPEQFIPLAGYKIRIGYLTQHDTLDSAADAISPQINPQWLKYASVVNLVRSLANRGTGWDKLKVQYEEAQQKVVTMKPTRGIVVTVHGA